MNPIDENTPTSDDHRFDLLADGELNEAKRRELLAGLDDEPGGWRSCALAFLESQSWKQEFGAIAKEPAEETAARRPVRLRRLSGPAGTLLAMAASFLVALLLASLFQGIWQSGSPAGRPPINAFVRTPGPADPDSKEAPRQSPQEIPPQQPATPSDKVWVFELPGPEGGGQTIRVPAVERQQVDRGWVEGLPTPMSPEVLEQFRQAGMQIEQRRGLLPLRMRDGRWLVVPRNEVDIRYVGNPTY